MLDELSACEAEISSLKPRVETLTAQLEAARTRRHTLSRDLSEKLRSMDVESPGNHGWEGRFGWFLAEMLRQARAK